MTTGHSDSKRGRLFFFPWVAVCGSLVVFFPSWNIIGKTEVFIWQTVLHMIYNVSVHIEHTSSKVAAADIFREAILKLVLTLSLLCKLM